MKISCFFCLFIYNFFTRLGIEIFFSSLDVKISQLLGTVSRIGLVLHAPSPPLFALHRKCGIFQSVITGMSKFIWQVFFFFCQLVGIFGVPTHRSSLTRTCSFASALNATFI